jgi:hypothetical protein
VTWQRHRLRLQRALNDAGFELLRYFPVQTDFIRNVQDVTFIFLKRAPTGAIVARGAPEWAWRPEALPLRRYRLCGVDARVVAPEHLLLRDLEQWEQADETDIPRH